MSFQIEIDKAIKEKRLYFIGDALPSDWYAAFRQWLPVAEAGDAKAQYNIGRCYDRGDGVEQDFNKAKEWYLKAAEQNDPRAFNNLYIYYSSDKSKEKNEHLAEEYLQRAVSLKEPRALNTLQQRALEKERLDNEAAQLSKENEKRSFNEAGENIKEEIQKLLDNGHREKALKLTLEAKDKQYEWASLLEAGLELEFSKFEISKFVNKSTHEGGIFRGTTQYYTMTDTTYSVKYEVKNSGKIAIQCNVDVYTRGTDGSKIRNSGCFSKIEPLEVKKCSIGCGKMGGFVEDFYTINFYQGLSSSAGEAELNKKGIRIFRIKIPFSKPPKLSIPAVVNENKSGCFVLTACYGDENHPVVMDFRNFRDSYLLKTDIGKNLVQQYYRHSPRFAESLRSKPIIKSVFRVIFRIVAIFLPTGEKK